MQIIVMTNSSEPTPTTEQPVSPLMQEVRQQQARSLQFRTVTALLLASLVTGVLGGLYGALVLAKQPRLQSWLAASDTRVSPIGQNIALTESSAVIDVVKKATPAVVSIVVSKNIPQMQAYDPFGSFFGIVPQAPAQNSQPNIQQVGAGSGFIITPDGLILTNKHVVADTAASYTVILNDGQKFDASVVARDPVNDIALVQIKASNLPTLTLADSSTLQLGQQVVAIGNSLGQFQNTITSGIISGIGRNIEAGSRTGSEQLDGVIQTDAAINPGNSGGPLLNSAGQVIGVNTATSREGQLVSFAIPSNDARVAVESYQKSGKITRPFLGVRYMILNKDIADAQKLPRDYGALIIRGNTVTDFAVLPGSPADQAGLRENDIILSVNGKKVDETNSLARILRGYKAGDVLNLTVYSKAAEKQVSVTLGETK
jgi:serine protease Do